MARSKGRPRRLVAATGWPVAAVLFHLATRDPRYPKHPFAHERALRARARTTPPPAAIKTISGPRVELPPPDLVGSLPATLRARRTWRHFSNTPIGQATLSTLLQLTWGVQDRILIPGLGRFVLKTSPSGGARHPIEAYVIALKVAGLPRGVYHYAAGDHHLVDLRRRVSKRVVTHLLANQYYFAEAGALVVMSAVFGRTMWKYQHSRAYRAILTEAGHFAQTFCLVATALGLAPFCTMAFRDSEVEALLGIDGLDEAALYIVGVGARPRDVRQPGHVRPRGRQHSV